MLSLQSAMVFEIDEEKARSSMLLVLRYLPLELSHERMTDLPIRKPERRSFDVI